MRFILFAAAVIVAPGSVALLAHGATALSHAVAHLAAGLPDPTTTAVMFAGFGLVAGARRGRIRTVAD